MGPSGNTINRARPLIIGVVLGLVIGLAIGLVWAWLVQPAYYAGGAYPSELSDFYQHTYVQSVAEAYMTTRDVGVAAERLSPFNAADKVRLLAQVNKKFITDGRAAEATLTGELTGSLLQQENWSSDDVNRGLTDAGATGDFAKKLGLAAGTPSNPAQAQQVSPPPGSTPTLAPTPTSPGSGTLPPPNGGGFNLGRMLLILLFIILAIALIVVLFNRLRKPCARRATAPPIDMPEYPAVEEVPEGLVQLGQWTDSFALGNDNYETSFSIENADQRFVGECGIGILEGFASGSPKRVLAFDVWLFDKTDIRTISVPVMSEYAFNDDVLRSKLPRLAVPVMTEEGKTFDLETSAILVKARILELDYGDGPPDNSYFASLRVRLTAYLKPEADIDGDMPIPEGYK